MKKWFPLALRRYTRERDGSAAAAAAGGGGRCSRSRFGRWRAVGRTAAAGCSPPADRTAADRSCTAAGHACRSHTAAAGRAGRTHTAAGRAAGSRSRTAGAAALRRPRGAAGGAAGRSRTSAAAAADHCSRRRVAHVLHRLTAAVVVVVRAAVAAQHDREAEHEAHGHAHADAAAEEEAAPLDDEVEEDRAALAVGRVVSYGIPLARRVAAREQERAAPDLVLGVPRARLLGPVEHGRVLVVLGRELADLAHGLDLLDVHDAAKAREVGRRAAERAGQRLVEHREHVVHARVDAVVGHLRGAVEAVEVVAHERLGRDRRVLGGPPLGGFRVHRVRTDGHDDEEAERDDEKDSVHREQQLLAQQRAEAAERRDRHDDGAHDEHHEERGRADPVVLALEHVEPARGLHAVAEVHEHGAARHERHVHEQQRHLGDVDEHVAAHGRRVVVKKWRSGAAGCCVRPGASRSSMGEDAF
ncbi:hypothetical protein PybrP1_009127 [[Pythium] brassicae (nom. inval.)]|nr:hypothetical protein PybrP1_009127 [[Pythium] brassicae (nom. inval.)]